MNNTIAVVMRITFVAMLLLGLGFFGLLGLLSIARELITNDHHLPPDLSDSYENVGSRSGSLRARLGAVSDR